MYKNQRDDVQKQGMFRQTLLDELNLLAGCSVAFLLKTE